MAAKRIGFIIFDGVMALDLFGPLDAFMVANTVAENTKRYELVTIGVTRKACAAESGVRLSPDTDLACAPALDTIVVPGGEGLRRPKIEAAIAKWLRERVPKTRRIVSICTGIHVLAAAGLLDQRNVTTHWRFATRFAKRFPKLRVDPDALFVKDGAFYTSAGVSAGIDLSLALIAEDYGPKLALAVARELVVYLQRPGGQEQFSEPLQFQARATDKFADIVAWIAGHLSEDLSLDALARRSCYSPRHFRRLFKEATGQNPTEFVEALRLNEARHRLAQPRRSIEEVADSLGFHERRSFNRAFERRFGVSPRIYRRSFHNR